LSALKKQAVIELSAQAKGILKQAEVQEKMFLERDDY
jgi:hypothetical protein